MENEEISFMKLTDNHTFIRAHTQNTAQFIIVTTTGDFKSLLKM